jgi:predicted RNA-binding protein with PUA-like domain
MGAPARGYWLVKTEPETFGWPEQAAHATECWSGVRNHQAKNYLKAMRAGDRTFFYHSGSAREIVGVVEVVREAYPDPTAEEGDWVAVDVRALGPLPVPVTLAAMKADPALAGLALIRHSRLSVMPVSAAHWRHIAALGGWRE